MRLLPAFILLLISATLSAQVTITNDDLFTPGEFFFESAAAGLPGGFALDARGQNQIWDISGLVAVDQDSINWVTVGDVNSLLGFQFANVFFNPNRSNLVRDNTPAPTVPGLPSFDATAFFFQDDDHLLLKGVGVSFNGLPFPIAYEQFDTLATFPVTFGQRTSGRSRFSVSAPGFGGYSASSERTSEVVAEGTLRTGRGDFPTLLYRSEVTVRDTISSDSLPQPLVANRELREYQWWAENQGWALLTVETIVDSTFGEVVTAVRYRDVRRLLAVADLVTLLEDETITFDPRDNDSYGAALAGTRIRIMGRPTEGQATLDSAGMLTYTPATDYWGTDFITYELTDPVDTTLRDTATIDLSVLPVNDPVVAGTFDTTLMAAAPPQNVRLPLTGIATDADADLLYYDLGTVSGPGTASLDDPLGLDPGVTVNFNASARPEDSIVFSLIIDDENLVPPARDPDTARVTVYFVQTLATDEAGTWGGTPLSVYPNPSTDQIRIEGLPRTSSSPIHYELADRNGRALDHGTLPISHQLNFTDLPSGTYFLSLRDAERWTTLRLIRR